jgi:hypothetical protein
MNSNRMNEKLNPFLEALKAGKTIHQWDRKDYTDPFTGPDIRDTDIYMRFISESDTVEIKENIAVYPDNEFDTIVKILTWVEFLNWVQQFEDKIWTMKIIG